MLNMNQLVGTHNFLFITLDTLRYDVAQAEMEAGNLPTLSQYIPGWEHRHSPGSFTYAAHQAFFAGFLPTPVEDPSHERLFGLAFPGSETSGPCTKIFEAENLVSGFRQAGYHTICIGGVGFFNKQTPLGAVIPNWFCESHWDSALGVTHKHSTRNQVDLAKSRIEDLDVPRVFLFLNISAIHQPNYFYENGASQDNLSTHAAALRYVDSELAPLFEQISKKQDTFVIICSDHGTAYGESGYHGHRLAHEVVWQVPYAEFLLSASHLP